MLFPVSFGRSSGFGSRGSATFGHCPPTVMGPSDTSALEAQCHNFLLQGLAASTCNSYASGQKTFHDFCTQLGKVHPSGSPCPADEWTLFLFATFLANSVQHATIKVYLSAVRSLHIEQDFPDPLLNCLRLQRVL